MYFAKNYLDHPVRLINAVVDELLSILSQYIRRRRKLASTYNDKSLVLRLFQ